MVRPPAAVVVKIAIFALSCVVVLGGAYLVFFGTLIEEVPMGTGGASVKRKISLPGGKRVQLTLHAAHYSNDDCERTRVYVELHKGQEVALVVDRVGFDFEDTDATWQATESFAHVTIPDGGIDAIVVRLTRVPEGCDLKLSKPLLQIREPPLLGW